MLEIEQDNSNEIHVYVQGTTLKFTIIEYVIISGLKCSGNIEEHLFYVTLKSALMTKYFPGSKSSVKRSLFIKRFKLGNFENNSDALNMSIILIHSHLSVFTIYNNIRPIDEEVQSLDLQMIEGFQLKEAKSGFSPEIAADCFDKRLVVDVQSQVDLDILWFGACSCRKIIPSLLLKSVCQDNSDEKWDDIKLFLQSYDVEGCSEDNATAILDALVESVVNHNADNTNVGTSIIVHVHNDHMCYVFKDVEGVSADFGPAILKCLVAVIENQKPDNDNVGTSNMQVDYSSTLLESAQVELDVILKVIAAPVDDVPIEIVKRIRTRSKVFKSPYTTEYASGSKAIEDQIEEHKQELAFDGFLISDTMSSSVIEEFKQWVEEKRRNTKSIIEIQKLAKMLPTYLSDSKFYDETSRTDWPNLKTYRDKITQTAQILNEHPFDVEYVQHIMQQECDSVDCGVFVAGYAEYLSEEMNVPSDDFEVEYHRMRYATLLRKYGIQKTKKGYASENDDPPRSKSRIIQIPNDNAIVCIE
ncbi:hypothetical protein BC332_30876 [Capsicum chinense]|nr:hypothetical protein BC332_30876 [Capsicum chinense]